MASEYPFHLEFINRLFHVTKTPPRRDREHFNGLRCLKEWLDPFSGRLLCDPCTGQQHILSGKPAARNGSRGFQFIC